MINITLSKERHIEHVAFILKESKDIGFLNVDTVLSEMTFGDLVRGLMVCPKVNNSILYFNNMWDNVLQFSPEEIAEVILKNVIVFWQDIWETYRIYQGYQLGPITLD